MTPFVWYGIAKVVLIFFCAKKIAFYYKSVACASVHSLSGLSHPLSGLSHPLSGSGKMTPLAFYNQTN